MKKLLILSLTIFTVVLTLLLSACSQAATNSSSTTSTEKPATSTSSTAATSSTPAPATTTQANWWDSLGIPQYGGTITYGRSSEPGIFDPYVAQGGGNFNLYLEPLWIPNWTVDPAVWPENMSYLPYDYVGGCLAKSWQLTDPTTLVVKLRQGIHWQNKPPVNGREFTSDDVVQHFDRMLGLGDGYTSPSPYYAGRMSLIASVTALDKYTVQFKFTQASAQWFDTLDSTDGRQYIEPPEEVNPQLLAAANNGVVPAKLPIDDWHNAVGTGPWMLTDYVAGNSLTYTKNPNYWGYDERHPQNQLPYADQVVVSIIPDSATRVAALRTGKVDLLDALDWRTAQAIAKTNPDLGQWQMPAGAQSVILVVTHPPFNDLNVRKAMSMAIDRNTIAQTHFGGTVDGTPGGMTCPVLSNIGYGYPYKDWPQSLKDEYVYNPTAAKQLLTQAGYPDGFTVTLQAPQNGDTELMQIYKSEWADIGVTMNIQLYDLATINAIEWGFKTDNMAWNIMGPMFGTNTPSLMATCFAPPSAGGSTNDIGSVNDPTYNNLLAQFDAATTIEQAKQIFAQLDQMVIEQHWDIAASRNYNYNVSQPYLKGYSGQYIGSSGAINYPDVLSRVWIDQAAKTAIGH